MQNHANSWRCEFCGYVDVSQRSCCAVCNERRKGEVEEVEEGEGVKGKIAKMLGEGRNKPKIMKFT